MASFRTPKSAKYSLNNSINSPSILKKFGKQTLNNVPGRRVYFDLFNNLKLLLVNYDSNNKDDLIEYNNLICDIRDVATEINVSIFYYIY